MLEEAAVEASESRKAHGTSDEEEDKGGKITLEVRLISLASCFSSLVLLLSVLQPAVKG